MKAPRFRRFRSRLFVVILCLALGAMGAMFALANNELSRLTDYSRNVNVELGTYASASARGALVEQAEQFLTRLSTAQADRYNASLVRIQDEVRAMADILTDLYADGLSQGQVVNGLVVTHLAPGVARTADIDAEIGLLGGATAAMRNVVEATPGVTVAYVGTQSGVAFRYGEKAAIAETYDPRERPWFLSALDSDTVAWTGIYADAFTGELTTTSAMAVRGPNGEVVAVVAVDILVRDIVGDLDGLRIGETGYAFLIGKDSALIAHSSLAPNDIDQQVVADYAGVLENASAGSTGMMHIVSGDGVGRYAAYAPITATDWSLVMSVESSEIIADALAMEASVAAQAAAADAQIGERMDLVLIQFGAVGLGVVLVVILAAALTSRSVTRPLGGLATVAAQVSAGNLDAQVHVNRVDEFGALATGFNTMTGRLKDHIADLARVTAEKERINSDLRIATDIQNDMLPKIFPPFSDRDDVLLSAFMQPAKEVGGDFYDFFFVDDQQTKLAMVIADVSGKSVPAALFMVIAKTLIKNNKKLPPGEVLATVNDLLAADNDSSMFVTTYYSVLDLTTGQYVYASAGHNPPLIHRVATGDTEFLDVAIAPPLGVFEGRRYADRELVLAPGDALLLYTDGVTEAFDPTGEMYGEQRLKVDLGRVVGNDPKEVVDAIHAAVDQFANGAEQSDDITMLFFRYVGAPVTVHP